MVNKESYQISKSQLKTGFRKSLLGALELAGYAKDIAERGGNTILALGLYSFGIEEYGKSMFFAELLEKDYDSYSVPKVLFKGRKSHDIKFKKALSSLPRDCTMYYAGREVFSNSSKTKTEEISSGSQTKKISIGEGATGTFSTDFLLDFETRMNCFYLDWNEKKNKWVSLPMILNDELIRAITVFEELVSKKLDLEYDTKGKP